MPNNFFNYTKTDTHFSQELWLSVQTANVRF